MNFNTFKIAKRIYNGDKIQNYAYHSSLQKGTPEIHVTAYLSESCVQFFKFSLKHYSTVVSQSNIRFYIANGAADLELPDSLLMGCARQFLKRLLVCRNLLSDFFSVCISNVTQIARTISARFSNPL